MVRAETQAFMDEKLAYNYFSNEKNVSLVATLGEAETLYSAGANIKEMAESGELNALHERCQSLTDVSETLYISVRDRLENILLTVHGKEDEIYESLKADHEIEGLLKHDSSDASIRDSLRSFIMVKNVSVANLTTLNATKLTDKSVVSLRD